MPAALFLHTRSARLRITPLVRRVLGNATPRTSYALELLVYAGCRRPSIKPASFKTGTEYNRACHCACLEMKDLKAATKRFIALDGTDADIMGVQVFSALEMQEHDDGFKLFWTPRPGATLRGSCTWMIERACVNIEAHNKMLAKREADKRKEAGKAQHAAEVAHRAELRAAKREAREAKQIAMLQAMGRVLPDYSTRFKPYSELPPPERLDDESE